ncbi:hypothetical protein CVIRNUC_008156 [Coccomyxa viridis]|uniref:Uncharacterized protein n=1 Tax=Coccomyxa viridis TaxID=1274662 RepID=A0AAV1IC80_9CHLO|nr:hypothetical protein CVIRNUC_008156 [Coccomyxa viridis]
MGLTKFSVIATAIVLCCVGTAGARRVLRQAAPLSTPSVYSEVPLHLAGDFQQCGGSVNCPVELQNTSLCGDRKYRPCVNPASGCKRYNPYYWQCEPSIPRGNVPLPQPLMPPSVSAPTPSVAPAGAVVHAGPSAPRLAAPAPSMQTMTVDSPPMQIFPGGYYLCKPGQPRKDCLTLQPGRKLLQGRASADAPQAAMSMQQSTGAQTAAYMYFVMPGNTPRDTPKPIERFFMADPTLMTVSTDTGRQLGRQIVPEFGKCGGVAGFCPAPLNCTDAAYLPCSVGSQCVRQNALSWRCMPKTLKAQTTFLAPQLSAG